MKKTIFRGAGVAIITPFTETGVNYPELGRIIEDQIAEPLQQIFVYKNPPAVYSKGTVLCRLSNM